MTFLIRAILSWGEKARERSTSHCLRKEDRIELSAKMFSRWTKQIRACENKSGERREGEEVVGALSFRATLGAARLDSRCESVSSSRLSGSSSPPPYCVAMQGGWTLSLFGERHSFQVICMEQDQVAHCAPTAQWESQHLTEKQGDVITTFYTENSLCPNL